MRKILSSIFAIGLALFVILVSLQSLDSADSNDTDIDLPKFVKTPLNPVTVEPVTGIDDQPFRDNLNLYQYDDPGSVVTMYVTVRKGNSADKTDFTWQEVNDFTKWFYPNNTIVEVGKVEAIVQIGDEDGPHPGEIGYGAVVPNATIQIRGASTSLSPQKSYKIDLRSNAGEWRGQSTINLNKHVYDSTRVRNKLNFDLLKQIPDMVSLRTQFVHLYVKDQTADPWEEDFVDYGLFTQIEQPNRRFLRAHLLDQDGQLYKANYFEFYRYADELRPTDDPLYDENSFSLILEIRGNKDHSKLIQMLNDVNNYEAPIEQTFEKYFDADNYFTWLAYNILVGNADTQSQNFLLYSPRNGNKWYFVPWDYDGSLTIPDRSDLAEFQSAPWENGVSNYWGVVLHNRVLRVEKYRQNLDGKINELMNFLTPEQIKGLLEIYEPVVNPFISTMPDLYYLDTDLITRNLVLELIPGVIQSNYDLYLESLKKPLPFYLGTPEIQDTKLAFNWDESYDFAGRDIQYEFIVSTDWDFKNIVFQSTLENTTSIQIDMLEPGTYFWQVIARDSDGDLQYSFDSYDDAESIYHYGMKFLYIAPDGEIQEQ